MANVTNDVANIRAAVFGKDVRESIADGIEDINTEVTSTTERQLVVEGKQTAVEVRQDLADSNETIRQTNETDRKVEAATRTTEFNGIKTEYDSYKNVMIAESNVAALQNNINKNTSDLASMPTQSFITNNKNTFDGNLRIAFYYDYRNNQSKMDLLKNLGFNCVYVYKNPGYFYNDIQQTIAFLNEMLANGIYVILGVDDDILEDGEITDSNVVDALNYIKALDYHNAIIGYHSIDEPFQRHKTKIQQTNVYNRIKSVSSKNVFLVAGAMNYIECNNYYSDKGFDILLCDWYWNTSDTDGNNLYSIEQIKSCLFQYLMMINNVYNCSAPTQIIPILPTFFNTSMAVGENLMGVPTAIEIKTILDIFALFDNVKDYGIFLFDLIYTPNTFTDYLATNLELQKLCTNLITCQHRNRQEIVTILPKGFNNNKNFVSSVNMIYTAEIIDKLSIISADVGAVGGDYDGQSITFKVYSNNKSQDLCITTSEINQCDVYNRQIKHSYSYDNVTFFDCGVNQMPASVYPNETIPSAGSNFTTITKVDKNITCVFVKVEMAIAPSSYDAYHTRGARNTTACGITQIGASLI
ncbi:hypothetical protein [Clostridium estertheticum]|uniref:hypothetical protein n=1 Tax=Clostridium estertheticum TaxID=238834 RepID=UPI001C6ED8A3|nr:hypothetical protein [Clostridium estertheticum]MBW9154281.1 hypothetical protein [Clostridium estertheticum]WLC86656.1 hypothetical protein KTC97_22050 [Clostridium estertheticum]